MKQILLYNPIFSFVAEEFINAINDAGDEDITIRVNSPGGSVFAGWGMAAALSEKKNVTVKVDGVAASMAFYLLLFADKVEALDVSMFMIHRADGNAESDEEKALLKSVNNTLKSKMSEKIDAQAFEDVTGTSIDDMFDAEERKDVWITAKQAKKIGLVSKINRLTTKEQTAMTKMVADSKFAEELGIVEVDTEPQVSWNNILQSLKQI